MRVLDGELQCGPQLVRVERAMAGLVLPARVLLDELRVADVLPVADAGRIAGERGIVGGDAVVGGALRREAHRHVGVALAGGEAVAHADDEQVGDAGGRLRHLAAADLHADPGAGGVWHVELHRRVAGQRHRLLARPASLPLRRGQPAAIDGLRVLEPLQPRQDRMALGIKIVGTLAARVAVACSVPAGLGEGEGAPSVWMSLAQRPLRRLHGMVALALRQAEPGRAMHLGVGRIEEEPERVLDLPHDLRLRLRHARVHHGQHEREANAPAGIDPHQSAPSSCAAPSGAPRGVRCDQTNALRQSCTRA